RSHFELCGAESVTGDGCVHRATRGGGDIEQRRTSSGRRRGERDRELASTSGLKDTGTGVGALGKVTGVGSARRDRDGGRGNTTVVGHHEGRGGRARGADDRAAEVLAALRRDRELTGAAAGSVERGRRRASR